MGENTGFATVDLRRRKSGIHLVHCLGCDAYNGILARFDRRTRSFSQDCTHDCNSVVMGENTGFATVDLRRRLSGIYPVHRLWCDVANGILAMFNRRTRSVA
jgi:hypothetical protein